MTDAPAIDHRQIAVDLFNEVWRLMETSDRTPEQTDAMIHAAHASRHHWAFAGTAVNLARGEWQISRVYAVLARPEPAMFHARRCLAICREHGLGDFDIAFAHEAIARASAVASDRARALRYVEQAEALGANIADPEDRELLEKDLTTIRELVRTEDGVLQLWGKD